MLWLQDASLHWSFRYTNTNVIPQGVAFSCVLIVGFGFWRCQGTRPLVSSGTKLFLANIQISGSLLSGKSLEESGLLTVLGKVASIVRVERMGEEAETTGRILIGPDWSKSCHLMCDLWHSCFTYVYVLVVLVVFLKLFQCVSIWIGIPSFGHPTWCIKNSVYRIMSGSWFWLKIRGPKGRFCEDSVCAAMIFGAGEVLMKVVKARLGLDEGQLICAERWVLKLYAHRLIKTYVIYIIVLNINNIIII